MQLYKQFNLLFYPNNANNQNIQTIQKKIIRLNTLSAFNIYLSNLKKINLYSYAKNLNRIEKIREPLEKHRDFLLAS